jgi:hypothetical protein
MGKMAIEVEGGSTAPENVPQQRQDAQQFFALSQDPRLDGQKLLIRGLELMGVEQPEGYIAPAAIQIPAPMIEQFLAQLGVPPGLFAQFMAAQQEQAGEQPGEPPTPNGGPPAQEEAPVG